MSAATALDPSIYEVDASGFLAEADALPIRTLFFTLGGRKVALGVEATMGQTGRVEVSVDLPVPGPLPAILEFSGEGGTFVRLHGSIRVPGDDEPAPRGDGIEPGPHATFEPQFGEAVRKGGQRRLAAFHSPALRVNTLEFGKKAGVKFF